MENEISIAHLEQSVVKENSAAKPKTRVKRILKALLIASMSLVTVVFFARLIWRFSGSNQWELVRDQDGVKIYSMKNSGSDLIKVKGVVRLRTTLAGLLTFMTDPNTCDDYGCYNSYIVERVDDRLLYSSCTFQLPSPFKPRQLVIRSQIHQNAQTKEVLLVNSAAPDKVPPDDCCFRVTEMNNTLRFTPLGDGQVELEYVYNMHEGGYIPDLMLNLRRPDLVYGVLHGMQKLVEREKFQNVKLDFIKEK